MRFRIRKKSSSSSTTNNMSAPASAPADGGVLLLIGSSPDHDGGQNESKEDSFFEAKPWLDSDSEDDFYSMRGDFTPSRDGTPDHQMQTSFGARISVDRLEPSLMEKNQRLRELLQDKQLLDDEQEDATIADSEAGMNGIVHAEEHLSPGRAGKVKKPSKAGCFLAFKSCWKRTDEKKIK